MRTPKQQSSVKNKSKAISRIQAANTSFLEANTSSINFPSKLPSTPQLRYGFKSTTPISAVKPTLRDESVKKEANLLMSSSKSKSDRELRTPVINVLDDQSDINTPINNTSVVLIEDPIKEGTPMRSRKSQAKNISVQRLITNDGGEGSKTPTTISTPKSALKKSKIMAELLETSMSSPMSIRSSESSKIVGATNFVSPFQSKLNESCSSAVKTRTPRKSSVLNISIEDNNAIVSKGVKRKSSSNNSDLPPKILRLSKGTPLVKKLEESTLITDSPFKSPVPSTSKPKAKTEPRTKAKVTKRRSLQVNLKDNSIICGNSTLESIDTSSFEYVSNSPQEKVSPSPKKKLDKTNSICGDSTLRSIDTSSILFFGKEQSGKQVAVSTKKSKSESGTPNVSDPSQTRGQNGSVTKTPKINTTDLNISGIEILENENEVFGKRVRTYSRSPVKKPQIEHTEHLVTPEVPPNVIDWVLQTASLTQSKRRPVSSTKAKLSPPFGSTKLKQTPGKRLLTRLRGKPSGSTKAKLSPTPRYSEPRKLRGASLVHTSAKNITFAGDITTPIRKALLRSSLPCPRERPSRSTTKPKLTPTSTRRPTSTTKAKLSPKKSYGPEKVIRSGPPAKNITLTDEILTPIRNESVHSSLPRSRGRHSGSAKAKLTPNKNLAGNSSITLSPRTRESPFGSTKAKLSLIINSRGNSISPRARRRPIGTTKAKLSPAPKQSSGPGKVVKSRLVRTPVKNITFTDDILTPIRNASIHSSVSRSHERPLRSTKAKLNTSLVANPSTTLSPRARGQHFESTKAKLTRNKSFVENSSTTLNPRTRERPSGSTKAKLTRNISLVTNSSRTLSMRARGQPIGKAKSTPNIYLAANSNTTVSPRARGRLSGAIKVKLSPAPKQSTLENVGKPRLSVVTTRTSRYSTNPSEEKISKSVDSTKRSSVDAISPIKNFHKNNSNLQKQTKHLTPAKNIAFKDDILTPIRNLPLHSSTPLPPKSNIKNKSLNNLNRNNINRSKTVSKVLNISKDEKFIANNESSSKIKDKVSTRRSQMNVSFESNSLTSKSNRMEVVRSTRSNKNNSYIDDNKTIQSGSIRINKELNESKKSEGKSTPLKTRTRSSQNEVNLTITTKLNEKSILRGSELNETKKSESKSTPIKTRTRFSQIEVKPTITTKLKEKHNRASPRNSRLENENHREENSDGDEQLHVLKEDVIERSICPDKIIKETDTELDKTPRKRSELALLNEYNDNINWKSLGSLKDKRIRKTREVEATLNVKHTKTRSNVSNDAKSMIQTRKIKESEVGNKTTEKRATRNKVEGSVVKKRNELDSLKEYNENILLKKLGTRKGKNERVPPNKATKAETTLNIKETRATRTLNQPKMPSEKVKRKEVVVKNNNTTKVESGAIKTKPKRRNELDFLNEYNENILHKRIYAERKKNGRGVPTEAAEKLLVDDALHVRQARKTRGNILNNDTMKTKVESGVTVTKRTKNKELDILNEYNENILHKTLSPPIRKNRRGVQAEAADKLIVEDTLDVRQARTTRSNNLNDTEKASRVIKQNEIIIDTNKNKATKIRATRSKVRIDDATKISLQNTNEQFVPNKEDKSGGDEEQIGRSKDGKSQGDKKQIKRSKDGTSGSDKNIVPLKRSSRIEVKNNEILPLRTRSKRKLIESHLGAPAVKRTKVIM